MEQVSPRVFIDPNDGCATVSAIRTAAGVILIDCPNQPSRARRWRGEVEKLGEIRYLIPTEHHIDHLFGLAFMPGTIIAHEEVRARFWEDSVLGPNPMKDPQRYAERIDPEGAGMAAGYRPREPDITFAGSLTLTLGDVTIEVFAMPGHVPADTAVYLPADRVLFAGDNVFHKTMIWHQDALPFEWLETLDHFEKMEVEVVVPGHGPAAGAEVFGEMKQALEEEIGAVRRAIEGGMGREEAVGRIRLLDPRRPVPEIHKHRADELQKHFVARLYDQIKERGA